MAIVNLTTQQISRAGLTVAFTAAADTAGWAIQANNGRIWLRVKNTDASPHTVTVDFVPNVDGIVVTDPAITIPAGAEKDIGPWPVRYYSQQSTQKVNASLDAATGMSAAALELGS